MIEILKKWTQIAKRRFFPYSDILGLTESDRVAWAFDTLAEGILILDLQGRIALANHACSEMLGYSPAELCGMMAEELHWIDDTESELREFLPWNETMRTGDSKTGSVINLKKADNRISKFHVGCAPIMGTRKELSGVLVTFDDISELEQKDSQIFEILSSLEKSRAQIEKKNRELHFLATKDPLTDSLNRRAFHAAFAAEFRRAQSLGHDLSCIMTDIDRFKTVNDQAGHQTGDQVLKMFSEILRSSIREHDLLGRYGGDEFCILLPKLNAEEAVSIAERIRNRVESESRKRYPDGPRITTSLGVASIVDNAANPSELNLHADQALYRAKEQGRNQVVRWRSLDDQKSNLSNDESLRENQARELLFVEQSLTENPVESANGAIHNPPTEVERLRIKIKQLEDIACKYSEELKYKSNYDSLTGLPNQILFYDRIRQAIARGQRYSQIVAILTLDISLFKRVNNALGRSAGDRLLKNIAQRLSKVLRESDVISLFESKSNDMDLTVSRLTADEFGILLTDLTNKQAVTWIVKRIFESISEPIFIEQQKIFINCTIGISIYPEDGDSAEELLNHAIAARQYAKQMSGHNNYQIYDDQMHKVSLTQMHIDTELRRAIEQQEFVLYFQPKIALKTSRFVGVEALIRWDHPAKGILSPYEFIGVAEQSGLIVKIGEWVIRQACLQAKSWIAMGIEDVKVAVNLSTLQLRQDSFSDRILEILKDADLSPRYIELEITETVIMDNLETAVDTLNKLHEHGFWISIDDFGTGYSSLNYLKHLPLDTLKIDRSFLQDILTDPYDKTIVKTIIAMAHSMDLKVTAEGVETEEQLDLLNTYSCDEVQGYLFSPPLPAPKVTELLQTSPCTDRSSALPSA